MAKLDKVTIAEKIASECIAASAGCAVGLSANLMTAMFSELCISNPIAKVAFDAFTGIGCGALGAISIVKIDGIIKRDLFGIDTRYSVADIVDYFVEG